MATKRILDRNGFLSSFDMENGDYIRTGILDRQGQDTGIEAFEAEFPQLLDIGIMGHCLHGLSGRCAAAGIECYQDGGHVNQPNMTLENYTRIIRQCQGRTFQVALGGRGDPDQHEHFEEILRVTRENGIIPNITTSGYGLTRQKVRAIHEYCGAAAVSYYKTPYMTQAIRMLSDNGVTTNLHFVLGANNIAEAIEMLAENRIPEGIERIVFLLHKPVGMGSVERMLQWDDPQVAAFFRVLTRSEIVERTGFDSCCVPAVVSHCPEIAPESFDACESGRFSAYIDPQMIMSPCSFDRAHSTAVDLNVHTVEEAWNSPAFSDFRKRFMTACPGCEHKSVCMGGCPICPDINLCSGYVRKK